jgi:hypothetical protein
VKTGYAFPFEIRRISTFVLSIALLLLCVASLFPGQAGASTTTSTAAIAGCQIFPANNIWNYDISHLPVSANSANYTASIGLSGHLHPDFGAGLYQGEPMGFPYIVVPGNQPAVPASFTYANESDPGPYPIPTTAPIEGGAQSTGDRHVLAIDRGNCKLYEFFAAYPQKNGSWQAGSGAVWNLNSNALRPATWTSADAAGLPILPGLVTYDEVASGVINHALRLTVDHTQAAFIWPARHFASSNSNPNLPPMGLRLRLKASVNISSFSRINQIILTALKHYGLFVADNGTSWHLSGTPDSRWSNDDLHTLTSIPGSDFEVVNESALELNANSGQVRGLVVPSPTPKHTPTATPFPRTFDASSTEVRTLPPATPQHSSTRSSGLGSVLLPVSGGVVLILALAGTAFLLKRRRRTGVRSAQNSESAPGP